MTKEIIDKKQCSAKVSDAAGWRFYPCSRKAVAERDGKWYCKIHDPEYIKKKSEKRDEQYKKECCKKCEYHFERSYYSYCPLCGHKRNR